MTDSNQTIEADVAVVGAGIVGLAHAHEARRRGLAVVVLDRDERPVGASVRNFGHLFFSSAASGEPLECALRSRERWLELGRRSGMWMEDAGTVVVARADDELAALEPVAAETERGGRMLSAAEIGALVPIPTDGVLGGFHGTLDLRVDPRAAAAALASLLEADAGATVLWRSHVHDIEPGLIHAHNLRIAADAIVVCPGPDYRHLPPSLAPGLEPLTLCQLQMLRVGAPAGRRYRNALATGYSLVRYPAFRDQPAALKLRGRLERERPELLESGIHLLITQLPEGDLVIGDTHTYGDTLPPFGREQLDQILLEEAQTLLGVDALEVKERWHGIYPTTTATGHGNFLITAPLPGVRVVQNIAGIGMTLSFGQAPLVIDELLAPVVA
jgi:FAD dependent oxidoreductase TIGR03364